jgi:hypothetical protein
MGKIYIRKVQKRTGQLAGGILGGVFSFNDETSSVVLPTNANLQYSPTNCPANYPERLEGQFAEHLTGFIKKFSFLKLFRIREFQAIPSKRF